MRSWRPFDQLAAHGMRLLMMFIILLNKRDDRSPIEFFSCR